MEIQCVFPSGQPMKGRRCVINVPIQQHHGDTRSVSDQFYSPFIFSQIQRPRNDVSEVFCCLQAQPKSTGN